MAKNSRRKSAKKKSPAKASGGARTPSNAQGAKPTKTKKSKRGFSFKTIIAILALGAVSVAGAAVYRDNWHQERDLTAIGNGVPTVVQVHDPGCPMCQALKTNAEVALRGHDDNIQYRIADYNTTKGRAFAARHSVGHVTLVTFAGDGTVVDKLNGVRKADELKRYFDDLSKRRSSAVSN